MSALIDAMPYARFLGLRSRNDCNHLAFITHIHRVKTQNTTEIPDLF